MVNSEDAADALNYVCGSVYCVPMITVFDLDLPSNIKRRKKDQFQSIPKCDNSQHEELKILGI